MREILFRGKDWRNGEWKYGDLFTQSGTVYIRVHKNDGDYEDFEVITETVGQYTGIDAIDGTKIFEGDIVQLFVEGVSVGVGAVHYRYGAFRVLARYLEGFTGTVVVGNIFDNPELLEEQHGSQG